MMQSYTSFYTGAREEFLTTHCAVAGGSHKTFYGRYGIAFKERAQASGTLLKQIKYGPVCHFDQQWQHSCRGTTLVSGKDGEHSVFCFNKFFNLGEIPKYLRCTYHELATKLEGEGLKLVLMNKEDGSNIKTFFDEFGNIHSVTLGSVDPTIKMQGAITGSPTFNSLSIKLLEESYPEVLEYLKSHPYTALVSEMKSIWNVIVTAYKLPKSGGIITPLCIIPFGSNVPRWDMLRELAPQLFQENGLPLGATYVSAASFDEDKDAYFDHIAAHPDVFGVNPEGFVAYGVQLVDGLPTEAYPWAKGKRAGYLTVHRGICLNPGTLRDLYTVQRLVCEGKFDDEADSLAKDVRNEHANEFIARLGDMSMVLGTTLSLLQDAKNAKEYAELVNGLPFMLKWLAPFLFKARSKISSIVEPGEFIIAALLEKNKQEISTLTKLQDAYGLTWWIPESPKVVAGEASPEAAPGEAAPVPGEASPEAAPAEALPAPGEASVPESVPEPEFYSKRGLETEKQFLVISDFDGTVIQPTGEYRTFETETFIPVEQTVNCLRAYHIIKARICVVTGRSVAFTEQMHKYVTGLLGFDVEVYCRPEGMRIRDHKPGTVKRLLSEGDYGTVVHFEDQILALESCSQLVQKPKRYIGILLTSTPAGQCFSEVVTEPGAPSGPHKYILTLVQPTGSGKTTILEAVKAKLEADGVTVVEYSPDKVYATVKAEMTAAGTFPQDGKVAPDVMYARNMKAFNAAVLSDVQVVIVDMCHDRADMLKSVMSSGRVPIVYSFMDLVTVKGKAGKDVKALNPDQYEFFRRNCVARIEAKATHGDKAMNSSTLDKIEKVQEVLKRKVDGCVTQVSQRNITCLPSGDIETMVTTLYGLVVATMFNAPDALLPPRINKVSAYVGVPVVVDDMPTPQGMWKVSYPHVTLFPPSTELAKVLTHVGRTFEFKSTGVLPGSKTAFQVVKSSSTHHVTRFVKDSCNPVDAKAESEAVAKVLDDTLFSTTVVSWTVFM